MIYDAKRETWASHNAGDLASGSTVSVAIGGRGFFALRSEAGGFDRFDLDDRQTDRHTMNLTALRAPA